MEHRMSYLGFSRIRGSYDTRSLSGNVLECISEVDIENMVRLFLVPDIR